MYTLADYFRDENKNSLSINDLFLCELCEGRIFVFRHNNTFYYTFMQRTYEDYYVYFLEVRKTTKEEFLREHSKYVDTDEGHFFRVKLTENIFDEQIFGQHAEDILPTLQIADIYD